MTWLEFKAIIESAGAKDDTEIEYIDITPFSPAPVEAIIDEDEFLIVFQ